MKTSFRLLSVPMQPIVQGTFGRIDILRRPTSWPSLCWTVSVEFPVFWRNGSDGAAPRHRRKETHVQESYDVAAVCAPVLVPVLLRAQRQFPQERAGDADPV